MNDVIRKFRSPGKTVVYPCAGAFDAVMACILLGKPHCFVKSETNTLCFKESLLGVVELFGREFFNE